MAFDLRKLPHRHFDFIKPDDGKLLHLEQPKLKTLKKLEDLNRPDATIEDLTEVVSKIIGKNREHVKVSADQVQEWMTMDDMNAFTREFVTWLRETRQNNPN